MQKAVHFSPNIHDGTLDLSLLHDSMEALIRCQVRNRATRKGVVDPVPLRYEFA